MQRIAFAFVLTAFTVIIACPSSAFSAEPAKAQPGITKSKAAPDLATKPAKPRTGIMKGQAAPDFTLTDMAGKKVSLSSLKNNVVCLQFWATWCPYCIREMPRFKNLHAKFSKKGLKILAINIAANDPLARVKAYQKKTKLPYPILYDSQQEVTRRFMVTGVPVSIIIDRKGIIQHRGYQLPNNIDRIIAQLL